MMGVGSALQWGRALAGRLPESLVLRAGEMAGRLACWSAPSRDVAADNLRKIRAESLRLPIESGLSAELSAGANGVGSGGGRGRKGRHNGDRRSNRFPRAPEIFSSYGRYYAELLLPSRAGGALDLDRIPVEGSDHLDAALESGPVCALTGHLGNWDLAARWFARRLPRFAVLVEELDDARLYSSFRRLREQDGMRVIPADGGGVSLYKHLRRGGHAGLVSDRVFGAGARTALFLGGRRLFPWAGMEIARRAGAALLPVFMLRTQSGFLLRIHPPVPREADPLELFTAALEAEVLANPQQWCVLYPIHDAENGR